MDATWSLRPPTDVRGLVEMAVNATGQDRSKLIYELVRRYLPGLLQDKSEDLARKVAALKHGQAERTELTEKEKADAIESMRTAHAKVPNNHRTGKS